VQLEGELLMNTALLLSTFPVSDTITRISDHSPIVQVSGLMFLGCSIV
jgi:hypothetical protein